MSEKKKILALTGVFLPYNSTISLLSYKHLRPLDYDIDVLAMKADADESLKENLEKDRLYKKFNIYYQGNFFKALLGNFNNKNPFKVVYNIYKYSKAAGKMASMKKYDLIYSSSHPNFSHIAGYFAKKRCPHVKWTASFSDAIVKTPYQKHYIKTSKSIFRKSVYAIMSFFNQNPLYQNLAFKNADAFIFVSQEQMEFMTNGNKSIMDRSIIIPFTYIKDWPVYNDLIAQGRHVPNSPKRIMHIGNIYGLRRIDNLLEAIKTAKKTMPNLSEYIRIEHYGEMESEQKKLVNENDIKDVFIAADKLSYKESLGLMGKADVLLLLDTFVNEGEPQPYLPSKIVEYYLADRLIVSIANGNSPISRHLENTPHICVTPRPEKIAKVLLDIAQMEIPEIKNDHNTYEHEYVVKKTLVPLLEKLNEKQN